MSSGECGDGSRPDCPLIETLFREVAPGARISSKRAHDPRRPSSCRDPHRRRSQPLMGEDGAGAAKAVRERHEAASDHVDAQGSFPPIARSTVAVWNDRLGFVTPGPCCRISEGAIAGCRAENRLCGLPVPARESIRQAIWLYLRFTLSFRDVEDLLAERGITVSYETVRRWVNHFGPMIAADLRKRRPKPHPTWHLDEVYLKIAGRMVYLWRAVDAEGEVLDVLVQSRRNKRAALKLMRKLLKKYGFAPEQAGHGRFEILLRRCQ